MDSANSGSLQSSSGGDDEYDSRAADSVFISANTAALEPLPGYHQHLHQNSIPFSTNLQWPNPIGIFPFAAAAEGGSAAAQPIVQQSAARNPKKRSRASRRAPTTVLTTDTTNFRAMVQEFTGIPSPPFNNSSSFPRSRLDFFASRSTHPPPYLRRHPNTSAAAAAASTTINHHHHLPNLFNIPNQNQNQNNLTSLLLTSPKFPFATSAKPQNSFDLIQNDDRFGVSHHNQGSEILLPSLIPSDHSHIHSGGAAKWEIGGKIGYDFERSEIGGKISAAENNNHNAAAARGEGMVESWICSSE
ncbi:hypothetical protein SASPL_143658 [Salvia splendens]|uniref:VQ domain-containing protein n=1 Tax=Salvia splendens TaxID=180675 RepID=A0A8X8WML3_SALSN|nr:uncharacterized protein LOC121772521 [Salvia splendens]KAG6397491.1 hypothetical protein SASPL_143658 [Salvia splendens]